jgi:hypothetical protein
MRNDHRMGYPPVAGACFFVTVEVPDLGGDGPPFPLGLPRREIEARKAYFDSLYGGCMGPPFVVVQGGMTHSDVRGVSQDTWIHQDDVATD